MAAAWSVFALGCPQVTRRHRRCRVLIHGPIWVWVWGGVGACVRSQRSGSLACPWRFVLLLLGLICFLYNLDENSERHSLVFEGAMCTCSCLDCLVHHVCKMEELQEKDTRGFSHKGCLKVRDNRVHDLFTVGREKQVTLPQLHKHGDKHRSRQEARRSDRTYRQFAVILWCPGTCLLIQHKEKKT